MEGFLKKGGNTDSISSQIVRKFDYEVRPDREVCLGRFFVIRKVILSGQFFRLPV